MGMAWGRCALPAILWPVILCFGVQQQSNAQTEIAEIAVETELTLGIRGENLLNDQIRLAQSYKKDEVLQPGLNIRLFALAKLN
jgi:hypothetical protein